MPILTAAVSGTLHARGSSIFVLGCLPLAQSRTIVLQQLSNSSDTRTSRDVRRPRFLAIESLATCNSLVIQKWENLVIDLTKTWVDPTHCGRTPVAWRLELKLQFCN